MKNKLQLVLVLLIFFTTKSIAQISSIFEAENAKITDSVTVKIDAGASQGKYIFLGKKGTATWEIETPNAGWYNLALRYRANDGDKVQRITINGTMREMGFSMCNNWENGYLTSYLPKGKNTLILSPDYGNMDVDYIKIPTDTIAFLPAISPLYGIFYKNQPSEISIFVDAKGKKLTKITSETTQIDFKTSAYEFLDMAFVANLSASSLMQLPVGKHKLLFTFNDKSVTEFNLQIKDSVTASLLTIIMFNIEHGSATLVLLPNGKRMLIDSGKEQFARSVLIPFFEMQNIKKIDYYILTHYDGDHIGAKDDIIKNYKVDSVWDYKSFAKGDSISIAETRFKFLNAFADGNSGNDRSLSFLMSYNGFVYSHGADNYAQTQDRILKDFSPYLMADVFNANHHFHGSVNPNFIFKTNPKLIFVSAEQAIYARGAYTNTFKEQTEKNLFQRHARLIETLFSLEVGTTVVRVNSSNDWYYETYRNNNDIYLPKK